MNDVDITAGHVYTVSFKAKASKTKYAYVSFGCDIANTTPDGGAGFAEGSNKNAIKLTVAEQTYTYKFTNWVSAAKLAVTLNLGAFDAQYDYAGNPMTDSISDFAIENKWNGTVVVSDFTITDGGVDKDFEEVPEAPTQATTETTTVAANNGGQQTTAQTVTTANNGGEQQTTAKTATKLGKVTKVKAKNSKKSTLVISWKKVKNAKSYQVKVNKKSYTVKKAKVTVKKLKKGKKYKVTVRAKASGYTTGAWSKAVKVTIKK
jgi:hypothetical protein